MSTFENNIKATNRLFDESLSQLIDKVELYSRIKFIADEYDKTWKNENIFRINPWKDSIVRRLFQVHERVLLVRHLREEWKNSSDIFVKYMYPPLCTYLLLTCFDQLGQPTKGWKFFPDWLKSKNNKTEREEIINEISNLEIIDEKDLSFVEKLFRKYHELHGVKNSFFKFLREILPLSQREKLLAQIKIKIYKNYSNNLLDFEYGNETAKEEWLFKVRNEYTHNLYSAEKHFQEGKKSFDVDSKNHLLHKDWELREVIHGEITQEIYLLTSFNQELEKSILEGLTQFIIINSKI